MFRRWRNSLRSSLLSPPLSPPFPSLSLFLSRPTIPIVIIRKNSPTGRDFCWHLRLKKINKIKEEGEGKKNLISRRFSFLASGKPILITKKKKRETNGNNKMNKISRIGFQGSLFNKVDAYFSSFRRCNYPKVSSAGVVEIIQECGRYSRWAFRLCFLPAFTFAFSAHSFSFQLPSYSLPSCYFGVRLLFPRDRPSSNFLSLRFLIRFWDIPSPWWQASTILVGVASGLSLLVGVTAAAACCVTYVVHTGTARAAGFLQLCAGLFILFFFFFLFDF